MALAIPDIEWLYRTHADQLTRIVRYDVRAPEPVIEDACQQAWTRLLDHRRGVAADSAVPWLVRTAVREAIRLVRHDERTVSLDAEGPGARARTGQGAGPSPQDLVELRERLEALLTLPRRQQRLLWLQGAGLSYVEIASREGLTLRTVERQLLRGKRAARAVAAVTGRGHACVAAAQPR